MTSYLCDTCGTQFPPSEEPPPRCPICEDERQYLPRGGQKWTTYDDVRAGHRFDVRDDHGVTGIGLEPSFAIGQRALLVDDVLWDCTPLVDDPMLIPLPAREVERIAAALEPFAFDRIYGGWWGDVVLADGKNVLRRSAERYVRALA